MSSHQHGGTDAPECTTCVPADRGGVVNGDVEAEIVGAINALAAAGCTCGGVAACQSCQNADELVVLLAARVQAARADERGGVLSVLEHLTVNPDFKDSARRVQRALRNVLGEPAAALRAPDAAPEEEVPCVCGAELVRPYPNDTGYHSTTECVAAPEATQGEGTP